jgi:butyrate kinase
MLILAINPGGGSTKVAVFRGNRQQFAATVEHPPARLLRFGHVLDQYALREEAVTSVLAERGVDPTSIEAIATRGGPLLPLPGGVYRVTRRVVADIRRGCYQTLHPSLLGPLIAWEFSQATGAPAWFVDPESTDEFTAVARISGLAGIERQAISHALSCRSVAQAAARRLRKPYARCRMVVAHLGTGITVATHINGRQVDASNANDEGPLSPQRSGSLPLSALVRLCFSGRHTESQVLDRCQRRGGFLSYFETDDIRRVEAAAAGGNRQAALLFDALSYQVAKEIGAYATVGEGRLDALVVTGGLARSKRLVAAIRRRAGWVAPKFLVYPGEEEMSALANRLLSVLNGTERERDYDKEVALRR